MMYTLTDIADDIATHLDADAQAAFARMNAEALPAIDVDLPTSEVKSYLILSGRWLPIKHSTEPAAEITRDALDAFDSFRCSDPVVGESVKTKLVEILDGLIAANLASVTDKTAVLAMTTKLPPKWPGLTIGKVADAIRLRAEGAI